MVVEDGKHTLVGFTDLGEIHDNMTKISGWYFCFFFIATKNWEAQENRISKLES